MAIVWHGRYPLFFEEAAEELGRRCGLSYSDFFEAGLRAPVVELHIDYFQPLFLDEEFTIRASLIWHEGSRLNTEYQLIKQDGSLASSALYGPALQRPPDRRSLHRFAGPARSVPQAMEGRGVPSTAMKAGHRRMRYANPVRPGHGRLLAGHPCRQDGDLAGHPVQDRRPFIPISAGHRSAACAITTANRWSCRCCRRLFAGAAASIPADARLLLATTKGEIDLLEKSMLDGRGDASDAPRTGSCQGRGADRRPGRQHGHLGRLHVVRRGSGQGGGA